jgi:ADP-ribosylglycohydrolase
VFLACNGKTKNEIKRFIFDKFGYNIDRIIAEIKPKYEFNVSCQGSVPEAIIAFLESTCFENAIRLAVSIGGDSGCFYKTIPGHIKEMATIILGPYLMLDVVIPLSEKC